MGKAARRARKNENKRMASEARERAERQRKQRRLALRIGIAAVVVAIIAVLLYNATGDDKDKVSTKDTKGSTTTTAAGDSCKKKEPAKAGNGKTYQAAPDTDFDPTKIYTATIATSCGTIKVELDAAKAPVATRNFVALARDGFYDGLKFHRTVTDFMIQGGDPKGDGTGGPGYSVAGEPPTDGYPLGSIAAAKTGTDPAGTMGSQFFIVTGQQGVSLPNDYARFGITVEGLDVATRIAALQAPGSEAPSQAVYIYKVTIAEAETSATTTTSAAATTTTAAP